MKPVTCTQVTDVFPVSSWGDLTAPLFVSGASKTDRAGTGD